MALKSVRQRIRHSRKSSTILNQTLGRSCALNNDRGHGLKLNRFREMDGDRLGLPEVPEALTVGFAQAIDRFM